MSLINVIDNRHVMHLKPATDDRECICCGADIEKGKLAFECVPCEFDYCFACHLADYEDLLDTEDLLDP